MTAIPTAIESRFMNAISPKLASAPRTGITGPPGTLKSGSYHSGRSRRMETSATHISPYMIRWRKEATSASSWTCPVAARTTIGPPAMRALRVVCRIAG